MVRAIASYYFTFNNSDLEYYLMVRTVILLEFKLVAVVTDLKHNSWISTIICYYET